MMSDDFFLHQHRGLTFSTTRNLLTSLAMLWDWEWSCGSAKEGMF